MPDRLRSSSAMRTTVDGFSSGFAAAQIRSHMLKGRKSSTAKIDGSLCSLLTHARMGSVDFKALAHAFGAQRRPRRATSQPTQ